MVSLVVPISGPFAVATPNIFVSLFIMLTGMAQQAAQHKNLEVVHHILTLGPNIRNKASITRLRFILSCHIHAQLADSKTQDPRKLTDLHRPTKLSCPAKKIGLSKLA
jgi:hypothetical protein